MKTMRFMPATPWIVLLAGALTGCGVVRNVAAVVPVAGSIPFRTVASWKGPAPYDHMTFVDASGTSRVLNSATEVALAMDDVARRNPSRTALVGTPSLPVIDHAVEQGILMILRPRGGGTFEIQAVEDTGRQLVIRPVVWQSSGIQPAVSYELFHYVAIARTSKPITFAEPVIREQPGAWYDLF